ncbi:ribosomal-protein-alanine N-acetyltransferase [Parvibaculum sedimenti]|uniref:Ribosomal-protein-alanine N-acetyltransferase n=1 Tax=Parvibaculum sedimenti TaxID=2608632 RepID=A0A6N6VSI1_9HYPH|nr:ribosomal protein S18-alanine N-acetyltransferase [Parvibaculum sedimenti]KAB7742596.1 ribosomal-protein-alanine N-acetyltransferase [Parvibaculum sedimenti]
MSGPDHIDIRPVTSGVAPQLAHVHATGFDEPWGTEAIRDIIAMPGTFGLMAKAGEHIPGFVLARVAAGEAEILTIAVAESHRRRGLGRRLMEEAAAASLAGGASVLFLEVAEDNPAAIALYRNLGFTTVGRRPGYYRRSGSASVAALTMRLDLADQPQ